MYICRASQVLLYLLIHVAALPPPTYATLFYKNCCACNREYFDAYIYPPTCLHTVLACGVNSCSYIPCWDPVTAVKFEMDLHPAAENPSGIRKD